MPEIDVSYETPDYSSGMTSESAEKPQRKTKRVYPTLTIPNNVPFAKAVTVGQEFTATVKFRVQEVMIRERADGGNSAYPCDYPGEGVRVEMEVQSIAPNGINVKEGADEEDGASALKKFFKNKAASSDDDGDE